MADNATVVQIKANGAPVGLRNNKVWAFLLEEMMDTAADWVIIPVGDGVQLAYRTNGAVLAVPSTESFTQATVAAPGAANSRWTLRRIEEKTFEYKSVTGVIESGWYCLELADTGQYLGRNQVEDLSLLPKKVLLLPRGIEPPRLIIEMIEIANTFRGRSA